MPAGISPDLKSEFPVSLRLFLCLTVLLSVPYVALADELPEPYDSSTPTDFETQLTDQEVDTLLNDRSGGLRDSYYDSTQTSIEAHRNAERYWADTGLQRPLAQQAIDATQGTHRALVREYVAPVLAAVDANLLNIQLGTDGDANEIAYNLDQQAATGFDAARELLSGDPAGVVDLYVSYLADEISGKQEAAIETVTAANGAAVKALAPYAVDAGYIADDLGSNVNGPYEALKETIFVGVKRSGDSQRERITALDLKAQDGLLDDVAGAAYNGVGAGLWGAVRLMPDGVASLAGRAGQSGAISLRGSTHHSKECRPEGSQ